MLIILMFYYLRLFFIFFLFLEIFYSKFKSLEICVKQFFLQLLNIHVLKKCFSKKKFIIIFGFIKNSIIFQNLNFSDILYKIFKNAFPK